jgi:putative solute:sodium symporter small subunit
MIKSLIVWAILGYAVHIFVPYLNEIVIFGFPLGFYAAAQGSLIGFVALIFWYSARQEQIDEECGVSES